jgi:hypothetical protein
MAWLCQAYLRGSDSQGPHEDKEGAHCQSQKAHDWSPSHQDPPQAGLQAEEGHIQVV